MNPIPHGSEVSPIRFDHIPAKSQSVTSVDLVRIVQNGTGENVWTDQRQHSKRYNGSVVTAISIPAATPRYVALELDPVDGPLNTTISSTTKP